MTPFAEDERLKEPEISSHFSFTFLNLVNKSYFVVFLPKNYDRALFDVLPADSPLKFPR
jgi:hypothetical protein